MTATRDEPSDSPRAAWYAREAPVLAAPLARLDGLVDWERRDRAAGMRVGIEPMQDLLARLGGPQRGRPLVLVAGTKGKGSTLAWVEAALGAVGVRTALFTSPHVESVTERLRVDGADVAPAELARGLADALAAREEAERARTAAADATWFDLMIAGSAVAADRAGVDVWLVEVGLGGRLDSTNALDPWVGAVTSIELEHTAVLGDTRAAIAREKAGIARAGVPLVVGLEPGDPAARAIEEVAKSCGAPVRWCAPLGGIDARNRALARALLEEFEARTPLARGAGSALDGLVAPPRLPGRFEVWKAPTGPPVVLDGAHVPESLALLLTDVDALLGPDRPLVAVFSCGRDKRRGALLKVLARRVETTIGTTLARHGDDALERKADALRSPAVQLDEPDPARALARALELAAARGAAVLVTGSLHLIGPARALLRSIGAAPC